LVVWRLEEAEPLDSEPRPLVVDRAQKLRSLVVCYSRVVLAGLNIRSQYVDIVAISFFELLPYRKLAWVECS
jgi:hypothetical protein